MTYFTPEEVNAERAVFKKARGLEDIQKQHDRLEAELETRMGG